MLTQNKALDRGICIHCRKRPARQGKTLCLWCARRDTKRQNAYNDKKNHRKRCKACGQVVRRCSICGKAGHRADSHDLHERAP